MGAKTGGKAVARKTGSGAAKKKSSKKRASAASKRAVEKYEQAGAPWWKVHLPG